MYGLHFPCIPIQFVLSGLSVALNTLSSIMVYVVNFKTIFQRTLGFYESFSFVSRKESMIYIYNLYQTCYLRFSLNITTEAGLLAHTKLPSRVSNCCKFKKHWYRWWKLEIWGIIAALSVTMQSEITKLIYDFYHFISIYK